MSEEEDDEEEEEDDKEDEEEEEERLCVIVVSCVETLSISDSCCQPESASDEVIAAQFVMMSSARTLGRTITVGPLMSGQNLPLI